MMTMTKASVKTESVTLADASAVLTVASAARDGTELLADCHPCLHYLAGISVLLLQRLALIKQKAAVNAQCINKAHS